MAAMLLALAGSRGCGFAGEGATAGARRHLRLVRLLRGRPHRLFDWVRPILRRPRPALLNRALARAPSTRDPSHHFRAIICCKAERHKRSFSCRRHSLHNLGLWDVGQTWTNVSMDHEQQVSQAWPDQASRPSFTRNHTMASEPTPSIHQAPKSHCAARVTTTTKDNHPHVTASIASARSARLPIFSAMVILRRASHRMEGIAASATMRPGHENCSPLPFHRCQAAAAVTYVARRNSKAPPIRLAVRSARSENTCPWRSSTDSRHIRTPADASSITLSSPKASSTRLPAVTPAPIATTASTVIHPIVNHSSLNASRIRGNRSALGGRINGDGAQHSVMEFGCFSDLPRAYPDSFRYASVCAACG